MNSSIKSTQSASPPSMPVRTVSPSLVFTFIIFLVVTIYHLSNNVVITRGYEKDNNVDVKHSTNVDVKHSTNVDVVYNDDDDDDGVHINHDDHVGSSFNDEIPSFDDDNDNNNNNEPCEFQKPYSSAPIPVILISLGRSGSSVTWDTMSTMLGSTTKAFEITGGNRTKAVNFFKNLTETGAGADWPIQKACIIQHWNMKRFDHPVITGFQWKPYRVTLSHEMGIAGLQAIANFTDPPIKVIFLQRNPIDRLISNIRHRGFQHTEEVPAHCAIDDEACIQRHKEHSKGTTLPTGKSLVASMKQGMNADKLCNETLTENGINFISIKYDKLYNDNEDISEWIRIFDYLGRSPKNVKDYKHNLKMQHVVDAFAMAPTSSKSHNETIANYEEVKETLVEADLGYLLH